MIACLMTGLHGATLAQKEMDAQLPILPSSLLRVNGVASVLTFGDPLSVHPYQLDVAPGTLPWFRRTFSLIRADVTRPMEPVDIAPPAPETLEPPGVVQNLRRVDTP